jgi:hypothetical protein
VYKVFSAAAGTDEETLIDAFLKAYDDGVSLFPPFSEEKNTITHLSDTWP